MGSNNSKYTAEFRERICNHIVESGKSAASVEKELGIDKNTVCCLMRQYRREKRLPNYTESEGIKAVATKEIRQENAQSKADKKKILQLEDEIEILKKALRIFMQAS